MTCLNDRLSRARARLKLAALATTLVVATCATVVSARPVVPAGFTPIFNGRTTSGWHWSRISHHGSVASATVQNGELVLRQQPFGQGGLLLTDKRYRNFELYLEVKAPWGCNSGIFLRSSEGGSAYQVELAQMAGTGGLLGEIMSVSTRAKSLVDVNTIWKADEFNAMRLLMDGGDTPRLALWINDVKIWEVQQTRNDKIANEHDGRIGLQLHWGSVYDVAIADALNTSSWKPGAVIRFRNIAIKELP